MLRLDYNSIYVTSHIEEVLLLHAEIRNKLYKLNKSKARDALMCARGSVVTLHELGLVDSKMFDIIIKDNDSLLRRIKYDNYKQRIQEAS